MDHSKGKQKNIYDVLLTCFYEKIYLSFYLFIYHNPSKQPFYLYVYLSVYPSPHWYCLSRLTASYTRKVTIKVSLLLFSTVSACPFAFLVLFTVNLILVIFTDSCNSYTLKRSSKKNGTPFMIEAAEKGQFFLMKSFKDKFFA